MIIKNAKVFIDGEFRNTDVRFDEQTITEIGSDLTGDQIIDAGGNDLYAGIIDCHIHGGFLRSFQANVKKETWTDYGDQEQQARDI